MSTFARVIALALLLTGLAGTPAAQAAPDEWRFLHGDGSLYDGNSVFRSILRANLGPTRFSPDGTLIATSGYRCDGSDDDCGGYVRVLEPDGGVTDLPTIPHLDIRALAWAPDGDAVAVIGTWSTPEDTDGRIYRVPLDGSTTPTLVYSDTRFLWLEPRGGLSWHPTNGTLAFIAHDNPDGDQFIDVLDSDQVFTVPAAGGAPTRFSARASCPPSGCASWSAFRWPTWSPDGTSLAVSESIHTADEISPASHLGILAAGQATAHVVMAGGSTGPMAWSDDGTMLAHGGPDVSGDFYEDTRIVDMTTGTVVSHVEDVYAGFADWQPCPDGPCEVWGDVVDTADRRRHRATPEGHGDRSARPRARRRPGVPRAPPPDVDRRGLAQGHLGPGRHGRGGLHPPVRPSEGRPVPAQGDVLGRRSRVARPDELPEGHRCLRLLTPGAAGNNRRWGGVD